MKVKIFILILLGAMGSCQSQHAPKQQETNPISLDNAVRYGKLDNGFTYYIRKNEEPENMIELRLIVKAGRMHEDEDQLEYAHLLEHLLAGKTKHFPSTKDFRNRGAHLHAFTKERLTSYEARIPSQDKQMVKDGIQLLGDWAHGVKWDQEFIAVQRGAVEGEMRAYDPYRNWMGKTTMREVLKNSGYKIFGEDKHLANIQNFNSEAFRRFYEDWYRPDLQAAIVVGDIHVDSMEQEIRRQFSELKTPKNPKSATERVVSQTIKLDGSNRFSTVKDTMRHELKLKVIRLRPNFEAQAQTKEDYRRMLLQQLYTIVLGAKARQLKQQYDPPFSYFSTRYGTIHLPDSQVHATEMSLGLETDDPHVLKEQFQRGLMTWKQMHFSLNHADLEHGKTELFKRYSVDGLMNSKSLAIRYEDHFTYGKAAPHPEDEAKLVSEIISGIDLEDFRECISEYGNLDENSKFIFFKGTSVNIPEYEVFEQWIEETDTMEIEPWPEEQIIRTLEDVVDIPSLDIMKEVEITENEIGVSTVELSNGIKIVFKPTSPGMSSFANTISIQAFRPNEVPVHNRQEYLAAKVAPHVLEYTGAGPYNKFELERFKREKGIKLYFRTNKDNQMIYAASKKDELPELFNLLYLYLTEPGKDQRGFAAWKSYQKEEIEGKGMRGSANFIMRKVSASWYPQVPVLGMEDLQKIDLEQVFHTSNKWLSSVENFTFIVTGDFDKDTLIPTLVNTLSAFPTKNKQSSATVPAFAFPLEKIEEELEYKNIDAVYGRLFFPVKAPRNIKTQIELQLISKALNRRIHNRLRIGSYSPTARGEWLDIKNGIFAFRIDFDSALGNEEMMLSYAMEEFRKLQEEGVEKEWLETAIRNELRNYESGFDSFSFFNFWPDYLQLKLEESEDPVPGVLNYGTLIEHFISLEDINAAIKKYMKEEHLQQFLGYPEGYHRVK